MGEFVTSLFVDYVWPTGVIQIVFILVPLLLSVAYLTYAERKVIAAMQLRKGPNVVGPFGLLQPFADAVKLLFKETILPAGANRVRPTVPAMATSRMTAIRWRIRMTFPVGALGARSRRTGRPLAHPWWAHRRIPAATL